MTVTDLEILERSWEFFGNCSTAVIDALAVVAQESLGWSGTRDDAVKAFRDCPRYNVCPHTATGEWLAERLA